MRLFLKGTEEAPEVIFDKDKSEFRISGKSYMEDATTHYAHVLGWLEEYRKDPNPKTVFKFELEYVNTASSKIVHDILDALDNLYLDDNDVLIEWKYYEEDEDMLELGQEYDEIYEVPFKFEQIRYDRPKNMFEVE